MRILLPILLTASAALAAIIYARPEVPEPVPSPVLGEAKPVERQSQAFMLPAVKPAHGPLRNTAIQEPFVDANSVLVYYPGTDTTLFAKNESIRAPIASLTKVLTVMVTSTLMDPAEIVTISSASIRVDGEKQTLYIDEQLTVKDLVTMMLVESSNDAAYALAAHGHDLGIDLVAEMNQRARELGMLDSYFTDPAGLDDEAYSTVRDLVRLVRAAQKKPELWSVMREQLVTVTSVDGEIVHESVNTNQLLVDTPGVVWGKTGNTDGALGCMMVVVEIPGRDDTLISVILGSRARFTDTKNLLSWAHEAWRWSR